MAIVAESFDFVIGVDTHAKIHTLAEGCQMVCVRGGAPD